MNKHHDRVNFKPLQIIFLMSFLVFWVEWITMQYRVKKLLFLQNPYLTRLILIWERCSFSLPNMWGENYWVIQPYPKGEQILWKINVGSKLLAFYLVSLWSIIILGKCNSIVLKPFLLPLCETQSSNKIIEVPNKIRIINKKKIMHIVYVQTESFT